MLATFYIIISRWDCRICIWSLYKCMQNMCTGAKVRLIICIIGKAAWNTSELAQCNLSAVDYCSDKLIYNLLVCAIY